MTDYWRHIPSSLDRELLRDGKAFRYFGGTAYLGIPQHEGFRALYIEGLRRYGLNNGTSRNNNVQLGIYDAAERIAAERFGAEAALMTSSGWLAAQLLVGSLSQTAAVRYAPNTHPALWGTEAPDSSGDFETWARKLPDEINTSDQKNWIILSNALNNLFPELYDFSFLHDIDPQKRVLLVVDDSHGIGLSHGGRGIFASLPVSKAIRPIVVSSLAKAPGIDAGLVLGDAAMINELKQLPAFLGASPPAAAGLYAFMAGGDIYAAEREKLLRHTAAVAAALQGNAGWRFSPGFPVFLRRHGLISEALEARGILISAFPYPDKAGAPLERLVLSSWHRDSDIQELILALSQI